MSGRPPQKKMKIVDEYGWSEFDIAPAGAFVKVNPNLLTCFNCKSKPIAKGLFQETFLLLECQESDCLSQWLLCMECGRKQRSHIKSKKQLNHHVNNNHKQKREESMSTDGQPCSSAMANTEVPTNDPTELGMFGNDDDVDDDALPTEDNKPGKWHEVVNSNNLGFQDSQSQLYFEQNFLGSSESAGIDYLVMRSCSRTNHAAREYATQQLPKGHSLLQMTIAKLSFLLTRREAEMLITALKGAYNVGCEDGYTCFQRMLAKTAATSQKQNQRGNSTIQNISTLLELEFSQNLVVQGAYRWSTRLPSNFTELRNIYLEGARSIVANLPIPTVNVDIAGHSYVSVNECIRHFLAHSGLSNVAIIPEEVRNSSFGAVNHSSTSLRSQQILSQPTKCQNPLKSYLFFWSDDVEPNRTKANRGSIWLMTVTIATKLDDDNRMENTYPVAIGRKGDDHDPVVAKVESDLEMLRTGKTAPFYIGEARKKVNMSFEMFATLQDQPERRDFNFLRAGNGAYTGRFGVSADHGTLYKTNRLPACGRCLETMQQRLLTNACDSPLPNCDDCINWDVLIGGNSVLELSPVPNDYPQDSPRIMKTAHGDRIAPFRITYQSLKAAVDTAHHQYVHGGWTNQNCEAFLEVEGLSNKFIERVLEYSMRAYSLEIARQNPNKYRAILEDATANPSKYAKIEFPAAWSRPTISLTMHPDVMMHLVFLGVVKTSVIQIQNCLAAQSKLSSFLKSTNGFLNKFISISLDWIAIQPYQAGKMGGWVSENFLGFSRILLWFFQNIEEAVQLSTDYLPPDDLPQKKWLFRHNKYWLQIRGLDTKGKKDEL